MLLLISSVLLLCTIQAHTTLSANEVVTMAEVLKLFLTCEEAGGFIFRNECGRVAWACKHTNEHALHLPKYKLWVSQYDEWASEAMQTVSDHFSPEEMFRRYYRDNDGNSSASDTSTWTLSSPQTPSSDSDVDLIRMCERLSLIHI